MNLIVDLQKDIINNKDILSILRKAYIISKELKLDEFHKWVDSELNGYDDSESIPQYRKINVDFRCHTIQRTLNTVYDNPNTIIANLPDYMENLTEIYLDYAIPELINVCNQSQKSEGSIAFKLDQKFENAIRNSLRNTNNINGDILEVYQICTINQIENIFDIVKNTILNWTSELKNKNICGNDYIFTDNEIKDAQNITFNVINYVDNSINIKDNISINFASFKNKIYNNLDEISEIMKDNNVEKNICNDININIDNMKKELDLNDNPNLNKIEKIGEEIYSLIKDISKSLVVDMLKPHIFSILLIVSAYIKLYV